MLFFLAVATATLRYERYGCVTTEVCLPILAHWFYANRCSKGEIENDKLVWLHSRSHVNQDVS